MGRRRQLPLPYVALAMDPVVMTAPLATLPWPHPATSRRTGGSSMAKRERPPPRSARFATGRMLALTATPATRPAGKPGRPGRAPQRAVSSAPRVRAEPPKTATPRAGNAPPGGQPRGTKGPSVSRRRFLSYLSGLLTGLIAVALGLPLVRFYVGNAFQQRAARWLKLGPRAEVPIGRPTLFRLSYVEQEGWRDTTRREEVYAVTQDGRNYLVLSNICTHLGCPVRWDERARAYLCPCHGGMFAADGRVLKGPPPRPLLRLPHKFEGGVLYVRVGGD
jgi:menaquinol-cytochrome c reductase iron-sulfur subunit